jgi:hypothetical protein
MFTRQAFYYLGHSVSPGCYHLIAIAVTVTSNE